VAETGWGGVEGIGLRLGIMAFKRFAFAIYRGAGPDFATTLPEVYATICFEIGKIDLLSAIVKTLELDAIATNIDT
jgi:hypothetical protein